MAEPGPASDREELASIALDLCGHLEWLRENGVRDVPAVPKAPATASAVSPGRGDGANAPGDATASVSGLRAAVRAAAGVPDRRAVAPAPPAAPAARNEVAPRPAVRTSDDARSSDNARTSVRPGAEAGNSNAESGSSDAEAGSSDGSNVVKNLEQIRSELGVCKRCKLHQKRKNLVFGVGSPRAELVFVGEGPGADEDAQGIPFVGAAGQLLTKMIEAMGFQRDEVYICNVVKCRPPGNRDPEPDEIEACEPFLKAQLAHLRPKAIVTLGKFATMTLLRTPNGSITRMRGKWSRYQGVPLMPTFHPSYLLRQQTPETQYSEKKKVWDDLQQVMKLLGREPPPAKKK